MLISKEVGTAVCHPAKKHHAKGMCAKCYNKKQSHAYYLKNKEEIKSRVCERRKNIYGFIKKLKQAQPCADCKKHYPYFCMDFDHVRAVKVAGIAELYTTSQPVELIKTEIAKCDLVCANCHRIRTESRRSTKHVDFQKN